MALPNQRNIELVAVGDAAAPLSLVLDSDTSTLWTLTSPAKAPVRVVRGVPGDAHYWISDTIKWSEKIELIGDGTALIAPVEPTEDIWTVANINTVVDGSNPARELNLRVWPLGLSSPDFQKYCNTGHFHQLDATKSAVLVATEFAEILHANYAKNRTNGSMGLIAYVTTSGTDAAAGTATATFTEGSKAVAIAASGSVAADFAVGNAIIDAENGITYIIASSDVADGAGGTVMLTSPAVKSTSAAVAPEILAKATIDNTTTIEPASIVLESTENKFLVGQYNFEKTRLNVTTSGMGPATYTQMASEGAGAGEQVAEREWFALGNMGRPFRTSGGIAPYNPSYLHADATVEYETGYLNFHHDMLEALGQPNNSPKGLFLAGTGNGADQVYTDLIAWLAG